MFTDNIDSSGMLFDRNKLVSNETTFQQINGVTLSIQVVSSAGIQTHDL